MDEDLENRLVRKAIARGLLRWEDIDAVAGQAHASRQTGILDLLVAAGRLDPEEAASLAAEVAGQPRTLPVDFGFLAGWQRYAVERFLGAGGMGAVFLALDPRLDRQVAIKFLHRREPHETERFLREARAQARVDHPNLCKVFEVGEHAGQPFIAMQYIHGWSLAERIGELPLADGLRLVRDIAWAVHAAHRAGLIHRDLKPANILVETRDDGSLHPYVADFGLARTPEEPTLSQMGTVTGTPAYLAPEQAQSGEMDRRSDLYSLGVILYELVTGQLPFHGSNATMTLIRLVREEPAAPRALRPETPRDLEKLVLKCLEKNPANRYDSARDLALDLTRFLAGEPVEARRAGWLYRTGKRLRKHRPLAALALLLALLGLAAAAVALRAHRQEREREALAERFGRRVQALVLGLRDESFMPRHDASASHDHLRRELLVINEEMNRLGEVATGPGHYALGVGELALHRHDAARRDLEIAWKAGEHTPEVAAALGRALGLKYQHALATADRARGEAERRALRGELERAYRRPALEMLRQSATGGDRQTPILAALIAFYGGRYGEAIARAREAEREDPRLYEATELAARVDVVRGDEAATAGADEEALAAYDRAGEVYRGLLARVPSDAGLYVEECGRHGRAYLLAAQVSGAPREALGAVLAACAQALEVDPHLGEARSEEASILWHEGARKLRAGGDPQADLAAASELARHAMALDDQLAEAAYHLSSAQRTLASWQLDHGKDPRPALATALAAAGRALDLQPELAQNHNALATAELALAGDLAQRGSDPRPLIERAIGDLERAIVRDDHFTPALANLGTAWTAVAEAEIARGQDPTLAVGRAVGAFGRAIRLNPRDPRLANNSGNAHLTLADYQALLGADPRAALGRAADAYRRACQLSPGYFPAHYNLANSLRRLGAALLERSEDPSPSLAAAGQALDAAQKLDATQPEGFRERAEIALIAARRAVSQRRDPAPEIKSAREALARAEALAPGDPETSFTLARTDLLAAEGRLSEQGVEGRLPDHAAEGRLPAQAPEGTRPSELACSALSEARERLAAALAARPAEARFLALRGSALELAAGCRPDPERRSQDLRLAEADLARALSLDPLLAHAYSPALSRVRQRLRSAAPPAPAAPPAAGNRSGPAGQTPGR